MHGRNWFSMPPWQGHFSMCSHALRYQDMVIGTDDQDSLLHSESSEHTVGLISTHEVPLRGLSIESQV